MQSLFSVITMDCWLSGSDFPYCSSHLQARQHYNGFYLLATARANVGLDSASAVARTPWYGQRGKKVLPSNVWQSFEAGVSQSVGAHWDSLVFFQLISPVKKRLSNTAVINTAFAPSSMHRWRHFWLLITHNICVVVWLCAYSVKKQTWIRFLWTDYGMFPLYSWLKWTNRIYLIQRSDQALFKGTGKPRTGTATLCVNASREK